MCINNDYYHHIDASAGVILITHGITPGSQFCGISMIYNVFLLLKYTVSDDTDNRYMYFSGRRADRNGFEHTNITYSVTINGNIDTSVCVIGYRAVYDSFTAIIRRCSKTSFSGTLLWGNKDEIPKVKCMGMPRSTLIQWWYT